MKNQPFYRRLGFAWHGIVSAWRTEMSMRQQSAAAVGVIITLLWLRPAPVWWALLLLNCGLVLAAELFNSALEHALDHLHPAPHPAIGLAKDCAAGAVLLLSVTGIALFTCFLYETFLVQY
ncbi:diacylglycerol kinase [Duganella sp. Leaf61]|uniref:diacylglycerol kinase n=1 Tax=Duganella sp. Leaf61 TaxID=1736227 RepID=UPI0006FA161F|nr:diacylglycerol kinase [Duganella sp. Leaf61]KQN75634.1 diacylglycerol kinase [Duganella sp. Leaf61]